SSADQILSNVARRYDVDRKGQYIRRCQRGEVIVNDGRLPAGVCEDRIVWHRIDDAVRGHTSEGRGLDAGAGLSARNLIVLRVGRAVASREGSTRCLLIM